MDADVLRNERLSAPQALRLQHDELRAGLVSAILIQGAVANAAKRVGRLCVRHFEEEEKYIYPVFEVLHRLVLHGVQCDMACVLPLVSRFSARRTQLHNQHKSIVAATGALLKAARDTRDKEVVDIAYRLLLHEREDELLVYPSVALIGKYVRERLVLTQGKEASTC